MLNTEIIQLICLHIRDPQHLLQVALVSKKWYAASRTNTVWEQHALRVQKAMPALRPLFKKYGSAIKQDRGTRITVKKRRKQKPGWVSPKGLWYVFARYLLVSSFAGLTRFKAAGQYIFNAAAWALFRPKTVLDIVDCECPNTALTKDSKYIACMCTSNFRFVWVVKLKRRNYVSVVSNSLPFDHKINVRAFWINYTALIRNSGALVNYAVN